MGCWDEEMRSCTHKGPGRAWHTEHTPQATVSMTVADVIVRLRFLLPPGLKGSQTQALTLDMDLLDIGTSHHNDPHPGLGLET